MIEDIEQKQLDKWKIYSPSIGYTRLKNAIRAKKTSMFLPHVVKDGKEGYWIVQEVKDGEEGY